MYIFHYYPIFSLQLLCYYYYICVRLVLVQVLNFNTICLQNEVLYECITDGFLLWTIRQSSSSTSLFNYVYTTRSGTALYTERIGSSTISSQLIFKNSTFLSLLLTVTNVTSLRDDIMIQCNEEMESLWGSMLYTDISGRIYLPLITW